MKDNKTIKPKRPLLSKGLHFRLDVTLRCDTLGKQTSRAQYRLGLIKHEIESAMSEVVFVWTLMFV